MFPLVGYMLLFVAVGAAFILVNLLAGWLIRPVRPHQEKETIYECGEPTIGSAWVQFDLRFYVVALLFVIFDVEVAFFFPWADVFGKANMAASDSAQITEQQRLDAAYVLAPEQVILRDSLLRQIDDLNGPGQEDEQAARKDELVTLNKTVLAHAAENRAAAKSLAWIALWDILVFFGVLLVGFAYLWKRGDLQWVKAVTSDTAKPLARIQHTPSQLAGTGS